MDCVDNYVEKITILEARRKKEVFNFYIELLLVLIGIIIFCAIAYISNTYVTIGGIFLIVLIVERACFIGASRRKFCLMLKEEVLNNLCENKNIKWHLEQSLINEINIQKSILNAKRSSEQSLIKEIDLEKSGLFGHFSSKISNDGFVLNSGDTIIKFSEMELFFRGLRHEYVKFRGNVLLVELKDKVFKHSIIENKVFFSERLIFGIMITVCAIMILDALSFFCLLGAEKIFDFLGLVFILCLLSFPLLFFICLRIRKTHNLEKTDFKHLNLGEDFDVYSEDSINYVSELVVQYFDKIKDIAKLFKSKKLSCAFFDNKIMLAFNSKDLFRPPTIFKTFLRPDFNKEICQDLELIYQVIDILEA